MTRRVRRRLRTPQMPASSLTEQVSDVRAQLFKAASIIDCCRLASASLLEGGDNPEVMSDALEAAHDLVEAATEALEVLVGHGDTE